MAPPKLGRLEKVELRSQWNNEASEFTPWLARPENIEILGDTLALELEVEAREKSVGRFNADILCKEIGSSDHWVLIENQLEPTDHKHLGQLLTYAAGLQAVTIVWVAASFTEEHRAALDWLNKITDTESVRFFGVEVELWRIGTSEPAPRFNIVSKPNDWSQSVKQAARAIEEGELSDTRVKQREYWAAFMPILTEKRGPVQGNKKPQPQSWMGFPTGRSGINVNPVMITNKNKLRAEIYLSGANAKAFFGLLERQKDAIEGELGYKLDWEELPSKQDSRIAIYLDNADPRNEADWPRQHSWLADRLNDLHRVFAPRVGIRELNAADWEATKVSADGPADSA
jgi:hypothetical protein